MMHLDMRPFAPLTDANPLVRGLGSENNKIRYAAAITLLRGRYERRRRA